MSFSISYIFRLIDQFTPGAATLAAAAGRIKGAMAAAGATAAGLARSLAIVGGAAAIMGAAFVLGGVKQAAEFEEALSGVRRVTDITREEMLDYGKDALKVGVMLGKSGSETAEIYKQGAMMGLRGQETLKEFAKTVGMVSVAWDDITTEAAAKSLASLTAKFFGDLDPQSQITQLNAATDAINELSNRSAFKAPELLKFFDNAAAGAKAFGLSAEQAAAWGGSALVLGQPSGLRQGYRANATFLRLGNAVANTTEKQAGAFKALGTSASKFGAIMKDDPQEALLFLLEASRKLDPQQRQGVLGRLLGNMDAARQVSEIASNVNEYKRQLAIVDDVWAGKLVDDKEFMDWLENGAEGHKELAKQLREYGRIATRVGSVQREFGKRTETLNFSLKALGLSWDRIRILAAMPMLEPIRNNIIGPLTSMGMAIGDWMENNPAASGYLVSGGAIASVAALGAALLKATAYVTGFSSSWALLLGLGKVALIITVAAIGVATVMWLFDNWSKLEEYASTEIEFKVLFPDVPEDLKNFMSWVESRGDKAAQAEASSKTWRDGWWNWITGNEEPARMLDPNSVKDFNWGQTSFSDVQQHPGFSDAAAIPQGVSVTTSIDPIQINPAQLNVQYTGPVLGPSSVPLSASAPRGISTVEGGAMSNATQK